MCICTEVFLRHLRRETPGKTVRNDLIICVVHAGDILFSRNANVGHCFHISKPKVGN